MPIIKCEFCGKEFYKKYLDKRYSIHFCSKECKSKYQYKTNSIIIKDDYAKIIIKNNNKDKIVLIDIEDIEKVNQYKWNLKYDKTVNNFYVHAWERGKTDKTRKKIILHRYLMNCPENMEVDHINRNTLDNRKCNLRIVKPVINKQNKGFYKNNTSGYKYIHFDRTYQKWRIEMRRFNKTIKIGSSKDLIKAVEIRDNYCKENGIIIC